MYNVITMVTKDIVIFKTIDELNIFPLICYCVCTFKIFSASNIDKGL